MDAVGIYLSCLPSVMRLGVKIVTTAMNPRGYSIAATITIFYVRFTKHACRLNDSLKPILDCNVSYNYLTYSTSLLRSLHPLGYGRAFTVVSNDPAE